MDDFCTKALMGEAITHEDRAGRIVSAFQRVLDPLNFSKDTHYTSK